MFDACVSAASTLANSPHPAGMSLQHISIISPVVLAGQASHILEAAIDVPSGSMQLASVGSKHAPKPAPAQLHCSCTVAKVEQASAVAGQRMASPSSGMSASRYCVAWGLRCAAHHPRQLVHLPAVACVAVPGSAQLSGHSIHPAPSHAAILLDSMSRTSLSVNQDAAGCDVLQAFNTTRTCSSSSTAASLAVATCGHVLMSACNGAKALLVFGLIPRQAGSSGGNRPARPLLLPAWQLLWRPVQFTHVGSTARAIILSTEPGNLCGAHVPSQVTALHATWAANGCEHTSKGSHHKDSTMSVRAPELLFSKNAHLKTLLGALELNTCFLVPQTATSSATEAALDVYRAIAQRQSTHTRLSLVTCDQQDVGVGVPFVKPHTCLLQGRQITRNPCRRPLSQPIHMHA